MTKLLEKAMAAVSTLPADQQDEAAFILLQFAGLEPSFDLTDEDKAKLDASLAGGRTRRICIGRRSPRHVGEIRTLKVCYTLIAKPA